MSGKSTNKNVENLKRIFVEKGCNSQEFLEEARKFFIYLQLRKMGLRDEDLEQDFLVRLIASMDYYDHDNANIATWAFSIGINRIRSYWHQQKKKQKEDSEVTENLALKVKYSWWQNSQTLQEYERLVPGGTSVQLLSLCQIEDHPITRHLLWELSASPSKRIGTLESSSTSQRLTR